MIGWRRTTPCERAAQWTSLELDGELSPLEQAALARHLERCETCGELRAELGGITALLRSAPLAEPEYDVVLHSAGRRRARVVRRVTLGAAFAAAAAAVGVLLALPSPSGLLGGPAQQALAFSDRHEQIAFVHNKYLQMEPLRNAALMAAFRASVPTYSRQALR